MNRLTLAIALVTLISTWEPKAMSDDPPRKRDLVVTRTFNATVDQVWKAWSESKEVMKWWGPIGFTCPVAKMDFREGGASLVAMRFPGGKDYYNTWTYRKIEPMKRIEMIMDWADADGKRTDPEKMGLPPDMPRDVRHVITFKSVGENKTEMVVTEHDYTSAKHFDLSKAGLEQCLDKMAKSFEKAKE